MRVFVHGNKGRQVARGVVYKRRDYIKEEVRIEENGKRE